MRAVTSIGGKDIRDLRRPMEQIPSCMEAHLVTALSQHWSWFLHVSISTEKKTAFVKLYIQGSLLKKKPVGFLTFYNALKKKAAA